MSLSNNLSNQKSHIFAFGKKNGKNFKKIHKYYYFAFQQAF